MRLVKFYLSVMSRPAWKKPTIEDARPNISLGNISEKLHEFKKKIKNLFEVFYFKNLFEVFHETFSFHYKVT